MVSVLGPTAAHTRRSAAQTVVAAMLGAGLAAAMAATSWSSWPVLGSATAMLLVGARLLAPGTISRTLTTPLPVLMAAVALREDGMTALETRLVEYLVGVGVALVVVILAEAFVRRLSARDPAVGDAPVA